MRDRTRGDGPLLLVAVLAAMLLGCGDDAVPRGSTAPGPGHSSATDRPPAGEDDRTQSPVDPSDPNLPAEPEADPPGQEPDSEPPAGDFGAPCTANDACESGLCVPGPQGEHVCTQTCTSGCPAGWECKALPQTEPDPIFVCVADDEAEPPPVEEPTVGPGTARLSLAVTSGGAAGGTFASGTASFAIGQPVCGSAEGITSSAAIGLLPASATGP